LVDGVQKIESRGVEFSGARGKDYADRRAAFGPFEGGEDVLW
jgi:hypothetical protein